MAGVSAVFFAYIGFDAVSTLAEESKDPQRDLPKGMIYSLVICTVIYIILALVLTGMVKYDLLGVSDPLAEIFALKGMKWMLFIVSIAAVVAMTSVLLVFQMGQPRIWMTMSRDGLMPKKFASIHPKYKTPGFATIVTGLVVGIPIFFTDENFVLDFTSIGTLFAFVLVCGGVLTLSPHSEQEAEQTRGKFRIPYINSRFIFPAILIVAAGLIMAFASGEAGDFVSNRRPIDPETLHKMVKGAPTENNVRTFILDNKLVKDANGKEPTLQLLEDIKAQDYREAVINMPIEDNLRFEHGIAVFYSNIPMWIFILLCLWMVIRCFTKNLSLIPVLGLVSCCYLLTGMAVSNWMWFGVWLVIGLVIYFCYGYRKSKLAN
jgi:amino acid transporter